MIDLILKFIYHYLVMVTIFMHYPIVEKNDDYKIGIIKVTLDFNKLIWTLANFKILEYEMHSTGPTV